MRGARKAAAAIGGWESQSLEAEGLGGEVAAALVATAVGPPLLLLLLLELPLVLLLLRLLLRLPRGQAIMRVWQMFIASTFAARGAVLACCYLTGCKTICIFRNVFIASACAT